MLRSSELSPSQIARMVGYGQTAAFSKFFRNATGINATEFRQGAEPKTKEDRPSRSITP